MGNTSDDHDLHARYPAFPYSITPFAQTKTTSISHCLVLFSQVIRISAADRQDCSSQRQYELLRSLPIHSSQVIALCNPLPEGRFDGNSHVSTPRRLAARRVGNRWVPSMKRAAMTR